MRRLGASLALNIVAESIMVVVGRDGVVGHVAFVMEIVASSRAVVAAAAAAEEEANGPILEVTISVVDVYG